MSMHNLHRITSVFLSVALLLPSVASATTVDQVLHVGDDAVVTRGDFIRAAVQVLGLEDMQVDQRQDLPYRRVAKGLEPYIRIAHKKNALEAFGYDLLLAQGISRGDALRVLVNLTGFDTASPAPFTDVRVGTPEERAVRVAVDRNWMQPLRENLFGVRRMLTGADAKLLLRKVSGESDVQSDSISVNAPTIKYNLGTNKRLNNLPKTQILEMIWNVIEKDFLYDENINTDEAAWKAAEGIIQSLGDKYTTFMRPLDAESFRTRITGEVTGIGAQVEYVNEVLTIVSPLVGSPAEAAGLLPGDQILMVDGEELKGLSFNEAVNKVRGPKGSTIRLTLNRNGSTLEMQITRDTIDVPDLEVTWQEGIAILKLSQFGAHTFTDLSATMQEIVAKDPRGIVLDLRKNPGGLLDAANVVASMFLPQGTPYVEVRSRTNREIELTTREQVVPDDVSLVILVDEGSASASELVTAALQEKGRAVVVGAKSYGKGTVQNVIQLPDKSSFKVTTAEWFTLGGKKIDGIGVHPDIGIGNVGERDAPLLKALELLR